MRKKLPLLQEIPVSVSISGVGSNVSRQLSKVYTCCI